MKVQIAGENIEFSALTTTEADGSETWHVDVTMQYLGSGRVYVAMPAFRWQAEANNAVEAEKMARVEIRRQHEIRIMMTLPGAA